MTRSSGIYGEAEAVVAEALVIERETLLETAELVGRRDGQRGDREQVNELWKAVAAVRDLATRMQNPLRDSPYAALGVTIAADATNMLATIRGYKVEETTVTYDD